MTLPPHIADRIRTTVLEGRGRGIDEEARGHGAIALMGTLGSTWLLRPDGSLWDVDADFEKPLTPLPDELRITALVAGSQRYPWLAELLPQRPDAARDCRKCGGRGMITPAGAPHSAQGIFCSDCSALGWVVAVPIGRP